MPSAPGTWMRVSKWPWMRCAVRPRKPASRFCRAERSVAWRCAGCCLQKPDILLLDEPTNHLDAESVAWLEHHIKEYRRHGHRRHPRSLLPRQCRGLDSRTRSRARAFPGKGTTPRGSSRKGIRLAQEEKSETERQKTLQRELEWIRMSPKGRQAKGKARINSYEALLNQETEKQAQDLEIYIPPGPRLGQVVIEANGAAKSLWRPAARRGHELPACPRAASSVSSVRTARARRRCSA